MSKYIVERQRFSQSASEITELGLEGVDGTGRLENVERCGSLLGLEVAGDPSVCRDPDGWCREIPATVVFLMVDWALDRFADVSGVIGTGGDNR